jgi:hypothetical protein
MRNRIINGAMVISQYNGTSSSTPVNNAYPIDRFIYKATQASKFTAQQVSTAPTGFINSLQMTVSSAVTIGASDYFAIGQRIEGLNLYDIGFGTSACKPTNLSFQVRSSLTGTFGGALTNATGDASYAFTYTISSANTWTTVSIAVPAVTTGTWVTDNSNCLQVWFGLGVGSTYSGTAGSWVNGNNFSATGATSVVATASATFNITGVQLEAGTTASPFEYRQYGTELALCQRYFQSIVQTNYLPALAFSGNRVLSGVAFSGATMRVAPTITVGSTSFTFYTAGVAQNSTAIGATPYAAGFITLDVTVTASSGASGVGSLATYTLSSEL